MASFVRWHVRGAVTSSLSGGRKERAAKHEEFRNFAIETVNVPSRSHPKIGRNLETCRNPTRHIYSSFSWVFLMEMCKVSRSEAQRGPCATPLEADTSAKHKERLLEKKKSKEPKCNGKHG